MLCKYALLHTSISCYTSTVTSIFNIAVCHTPCGVSINKDTCDLLYFEFCVFFVSARQVPVMWLHISWVFCFPVIRGDIFKELHLTETGTQKHKRFQSWGLFESPGKFTLWHRWVRGQLKAWHQSYMRNNWTNEGEEKRRHCLPPRRTGSIQSLRLNPQNPLFSFHLCSSESMLGLNISIEEEDCDCWNTKNMEPADKKSKLSASGEFPVCGVYPDRVGFFTFGVLKTCSERSRGRLEEGEEQWEQRERKVSRGKEEDGVFFLQAADRR